MIAEQQEAARARAYAGRHPSTDARHRSAGPRGLAALRARLMDARRQVALVGAAGFRRLVGFVPVSVRARAAAEPAREALRWLRERVRGPSPSAPPEDGFVDDLPGPTRADALRERASVRHGRAPATARAERPRVAAVVSIRNSARSLERLLASIERTWRYPALELWIVDRGSIDDTRQVVARHQGALELRPVWLGEDRGFADAVNHAVQAIEAPLVLLLRDEVVFTGDVLGRLVDELAEPDVGVVGLSLLFPPKHPVYGGRLAHGGLKLYAERAAPFLSPYALSARRGLTSAGAAVVEVVPAVSSAVALVRRDELLALGGLDSGYTGGLEDLDLGLRFRQRGLKSIVVRDVAAEWRAGASLGPPPRRPVAPRAGRRHLSSQHGRALMQAYLRDKRAAERFFSDEPLVVAFAVAGSEPGTGAADLARANALAEALEGAFGWRTEVRTRTGEAWYDLEGVDVVVALTADFDPRGIRRARPQLLRGAWVRSPPAVWSARLQEYDLVLAGSPEVAARLRFEHDRAAVVLPLDPDPARARDDGETAGRDTGSDVSAGGAIDAAARALAETLDQFADPPHRALRGGPVSAATIRRRVAIKVPTKVPTGEVARAAGAEDAPTELLELARSIRRCLHREGHAVRIDGSCDWETPAGAFDDIVIVLRGMRRFEPQPHQASIVWNVGAPEAVTDDEYEAFDHVFVASTHYGHQLGARLHVRVEPLLWCTDPDRFYPDPTVPRREVVFMGDADPRPRPMLVDAMEADLPLSVYGGAEPMVGEQLRQCFCGAQVVLNDHHGPLRDHGFLARRLFDAAACGAPIVTDPVRGLASVFGDVVRTYVTVDELRAVVRAHLADPQPWLEQAAALAQEIRRFHRVEARVNALMAAAERALAGKA